MHLLLQRASVTKVPVQLAATMAYKQGPLVLGHLLSNRSRYSTTQKKPRGREAIKFPFVWPSEAKHIPKHSSIQASSKTIFQKITAWVAETSVKVVFEQVFSQEYRNTMEDKMVGVALQSVIEAIDNRDYSRLEDICTPQISKMYKYALSHLDAQKHRIRVSMVSSGMPWIDGFMLKSGPPEAFNTEVPFPKRHEQFKYKFQNTARIAASRKQMEGKDLSAFNPLYNEDGDSRMSVDVWCKVPVSVKIELSRNGKVVDSDQGEMTIPLTFSSPAYENPVDLTKAVLKLEGAEDLEPFRWSISDIFFIIDSNEARNIHQCYFGKKANGQSGTQE